MKPRTHTNSHEFILRRLTLLIVSVAVVLSGCNNKTPEESDAGTKELLLYCGAGVRPPVQQIAETFERERGVKIVIDYAGSEVLLSKIKLARRGDLYMPGDEYYVDQAAAEGMVLSQKSVCYLVPTILVQKGNPKKIGRLQDLLRPGLRLGLGDARTCAVGRTAKEVFTRNNIAWEDVEKNLAFQSLTVNELGMQIQAGSLDAVIVWDAIARYYSEHGTEVPIPTEQNVISTVDLGVLSFTMNRPLAEEFVAFALSKRGQDIFAQHNYRTEPPG